MGYNIVQRPFLVDSFDAFNKYALYDATVTKVVDTAEAYIAASSGDDGVLLIIADGTTPSDGEISLATVESVTTGFSVGDYVTHQAEVSHNNTTYTRKYTKKDEVVAPSDIQTEVSSTSTQTLPPSVGAVITKLNDYVLDSDVETTNIDFDKEWS